MVRSEGEMRNSFQDSRRTTAPTRNRSCRFKSAVRTARMDTGLRCVSGLMVVLLAVTLTGCNLVKSILVGPSIATKKVPNAVVGISYDAKIEVSGAYFSSVWISAGT